MSRWFLLYGSLLFFCVGIVFAGLMYEWIIIRIPSNVQRLALLAKDASEEKAIEIHICKRGRWQIERVCAVCSSHNDQTYLRAVISSWLAMMQEEQIVPNNVLLQSALCSDHADIAYLSFSNSFIQGNKPTIENLLCIESLLRTIRKNNISKVQSCLFLVNHAIMHDAHLDFSQPWPIIGYLHNC